MAKRRLLGSQPVRFSPHSLGLEALHAAPAPFYSLEDAPLDDEPDADDRDGGLTEAHAQADRGELIPHGEAKRILGVW
jgi:hypothetical protein